MKSRVSQRGQVTIPKRLRDTLGIREGEILDFNEERGRLVATKVGARSPIDELFGIAAPARSTDELLADLRGEVDSI